MKKAFLIFVVLLMILGTAVGSCYNNNGVPGFIELVSYAQTAAEDSLMQDVKISMNEYDWEIVNTGLRYKLESQIEVQSIYYDMLMIYTFDDDTYESYVLNQFDLNGISFI